MRSRKQHDERQLTLNLAVEHHPFSRARDAANEPEFKRFPVEAKKAGLARETFSVDALAENIQAEDRLRLLEPTSLPKHLRGWSPRARPQTAIIAYAAQRAYERRIARERGETATDRTIQEFMSQRAGRLNRLVNQLRRRGSNP